jgi:AraC-like DNA-binding protein
MDFREAPVLTFSFERTDAFVWVYPDAADTGTAERTMELSCGGAAALLYILGGTGRAIWEEGGEDYAAGCVVCARRTYTLTLRPDTATRYICLHLRNASEFMNAMDTCIAAPGARVADGFSRVLRLAQEKLPVGIHEASAAVYALLMEILALSRREDGGSLVCDALRIMEEEYSLLGGVDELSERLGVTKHHLIRAFTEKMGVSPGQYLRRIRLENAKLLLAYREYSVDAIAGMVGYSGGNYFCKVFRQAEGLSPGQFRAKSRPRADAAVYKRLAYLERFVNV